jgi:hypothetical protein
MMGCRWKSNVSALGHSGLLPLARLEERKQFILDTIRRLGRPIWAGDVAINVADQVLYRPTFRALVAEGKLVRRPGAKGNRAYYYFD